MVGIDAEKAVTKVVYEFGSFRLDPAERLLQKDGQPIPLTPKAFDLLVYLAERAGRLVEKQALMSALWPDAVVEEANLAYNISALRKALGDGHDGEHIIQTVPTRGYRFAAPVHDVAAPDHVAASSGAVARRTAFAAVMLAVGALAGGLVVWRPWRSDSTTRPVVRFELSGAVRVRDITVPAISSDGRRIVYGATAGTQQRLYLRSLDSLQGTPLPVNGHYPVFSPDGRSIAFTHAGNLMTLDLATGRTAQLQEECVQPTWGPDGMIYYSRLTGLGLARVPAAGGAPQTVTTLEAGEIFHGWPEFLPDGRHLLFGVIRDENFEDVGTDVLSLDTGERRPVLERGYFARFLPTGHLLLLYAGAGSLLAVPFDVRSFRVHGEPVRVLAGVATDVIAFFAVSAAGTLVYHPGGVLTDSNEMVWLDNASAHSVAAPPGSYGDPSLSPDDRRLAVAPRYGINRDIWVHDFGRRTWTRITTDTHFKAGPVWYPGDPNRIVYTEVRPGHGLGNTHALMARRADGSGSPELLYESAHKAFATSSAPAAGLVAFAEIGPKNKADLWLLDLRGKPAARPFLQTPFAENCPALSPDGRWLAYESDESGHPEIYVRPLSGDGKWQVSADGGDRPRWSRDGQRIVYRSGRRMMAVDVKTRPSFVAERPQVLAEGEFEHGGFSSPNYDISVDGRRVLVIKLAPEQPSLPLVVVENWFTELRQRLNR